MKNTLQHRAFTLIELLIVIAIIGILASIVIASLNTQKTQKDVESAALVVAAKLREAQTAALTGSQNIPNTIPCSYRVTWGSTNITNSYVYKDASENCTQVFSIGSVVLPGAVTFSGSASVDFTLPYGKISTARVITMQKGGVSRVVCVKVNGLIEPQLVAGNC